MSTRPTDAPALVRLVRAIDVMTHSKLGGSRVRDSKGLGGSVELPGGGFDRDECRHRYIAHLRERLLPSVQLG